MSVLRVIFFCLMLVATCSRAEIVLLDDAGREVLLEQAARRIISLAPHITELLFASGATDQVVGVVEYSNYPERAKAITRIGSYSKFDIERIIGFNPDLIIAWKSGNPEPQVNELLRLGYKIYYNEPRQLTDIAQSLRQLGKLMATEKVADRAAIEYEQGLNALVDKYKNREKVRVFYQVWKQPLFTINGEHIISRVIALCGGINVFAGLSILAPNVDIESVLGENPDVIVAGMSDTRLDWLDSWKQWTAINAVKNNHLYAIDADLIVRHSPRMLLGIDQMCTHIEKARKQS